MIQTYLRNYLITALTLSTAMFILAMIVAVSAWLAALCGFNFIGELIFQVLLFSALAAYFKTVEDFRS